MLNPEFFNQWIAYLCQVKGWHLDQSATEVLYQQCCSVSDQDFQNIGKAIAETPNARPDRLLSAVREYRLLSTPETPSLPEAPKQASEALEGAMRGRRFMIWTLIVRRNPELQLQEPYRTEGQGREHTGNLTETGQWLSTLPWTPEEEAQKGSISIAQVLKEGLNQSIAKSLIAEYQKLFQEPQTVGLP